MYGKNRENSLVPRDVWSRGHKSTFFNCRSERRVKTPMLAESVPSNDDGDDSLNPRVRNARDTRWQTTRNETNEHDSLVENSTVPRKNENTGCFERAVVAHKRLVTSSQMLPTVSI